MEQIYEAVRNRDEDRAAQAMQRFFAASLEYLDRVGSPVMNRVLTWDSLDF